MRRKLRCGDGGGCALKSSKMEDYIWRPCLALNPRTIISSQGWKDVMLSQVRVAPQADERKREGCHFLRSFLCAARPLWLAVIASTTSLLAHLALCFFSPLSVFRVSLAVASSCYSRSLVVLCASSRSMEGFRGLGYTMRSRLC